MNDRVRKSIMLVVLWVVSGLIWMSSVQEAEAKTYRGPFEGRVVDADTQEPIEGAVVRVEWDILHGWVGESFYDEAEVLTDANGGFSIPKKWSLNPWYNIVMESSVMIYKRGYGSVGHAYWPTLHEAAKFYETLTPEKRKLMGPKLYYNIRFEGELPVFLLKKLDTREERWRSIPSIDGDVPDDKAKLLREEIEKERDVLENKRGDQVQ